MNKCTLIVLCTCLFVIGCGTKKPPIEQQNLLVKCESLPNLEGTTGKAVLSTMTVWGSMYSECSERHNALIDAVNNLNK